MSDAHCEPGPPDAAATGGGRPTRLLAGNPNDGKTTLFNALPGPTAKVSNYPGITVDKRSGELPLPGGVIASLVDLPGTYSLNARSAEEQIAFDALTASPDAVIVCLDATQLARSAYLLAQIQELGERCVVALTMVEEAKDATPDVPALRALGCIECKQPVIEGVLREQEPMRERAKMYEDDPQLVKNIIADGCKKARKLAQETMRDVREGIGVDYT